MQGLTGSQTKSCTFKGLRGEGVAAGAYPMSLESALSNWNYKSYVLRITFTPGSCFALPSGWNPLYAHIRAKHFGDHNRSVGLLIILDDGYPSAAHGES